MMVGEQVERAAVNTGDAQLVARAARCGEW
jgi:hypothetical protein